MMFFLLGTKQDICQKTAFKGEGGERSERKFSRFAPVSGKMDEGKVRVSSVLMPFSQMFTFLLWRQRILNPINSTWSLLESHSTSAPDSTVSNGLYWYPGGNHTTNSHCRKNRLQFQLEQNFKIYPFVIHEIRLLWRQSYKNCPSKTVCVRAA